MNPKKKLISIKEGYLRSLPSHINNLLKHWDTYHRNWDDQSAWGMLCAIRSMTGASAALQIPEINQTSKPWFDYLKLLLPGNTLPGDGVSYCEENIQCFKDIKNHLESLDAAALKEWAADQLPDLPFDDHPGSHEVVYLLEDAEEDAAPLMTALEEAGYEPRLFAAFMDFYMAFMEYKPACVILSSFLDEDGEILEHIANFKKIPESKVPAILLEDSRSSLPDDQELLALGITRVVSKPANPDNLPDYIKEALTDEGPQLGLRVLLLEEDPYLAEYFTLALKAGGFPVYLASSLEEAQEKTGTDYPDLVLVDLDQPGIDPVEITGGLRKNPAWYRIPFIFLSSDSETDMSRLKGLVKQIDGFIDTGVNPTDLFNLVERHTAKIMK